MIWLTNSTLSRLRDQLLSRGQRPSVVHDSVIPGRPDSSIPPGVVALVALTREYGPLCEAMYLMMSSDGSVTNDEREVLKGALRNLSGDALRSTQVESLLDQAAKNIADEGRALRMASVLGELREDPTRAEVAFVLSAAIAFADNVIADEENETLNMFADRLGINEERANELLDSVESDLATARATTT